MLEIDVEFQGDNAGELAARIASGMLQGANVGLVEMEGTAKGLCPVDIGQLRESIGHAAEQASGTEVSGVVGTNLEYSLYVEMGTGPAGRDTSVANKSPASVSYRAHGWWIHESQIGRDVAEKYHFFHIDTEKGRFYFTNGQPAHPFLYPALSIHKDDLPRHIAEAIRQKLEGGGG